MEYNKGMKLTTVVLVQPEEPQALLHMIRTFNEACNYLSAIAFQERVFAWLPLQRRAYRGIRDKFGLHSHAAMVAIRKVAYAYKVKERRCQVIQFRPLGAIPLNQHRYKRDGTVLVYGLRLPFIARPGITLSSKAQATLTYKGGKFLIHQCLEVEEESPYDPDSYLGCDLGIVNILTDSDGEAYAGGHLNGLRRRHAKLRRRLQAKGTRSAKRLLLHRRRMESRFGRWVNHNISKQVVQKAKDTQRGIALEDLQGIRERITVRKPQRRQHHAWSFNQLRQFISYKAGLLGVPVALVDPRNTSRTCPECGYVDKANRVSQSEFRCQACGVSGNADIFAAVNIGRRAAGNQPHGASWDSSKSPLLGVEG